jgi:hypothetical protein
MSRRAVVAVVLIGITAAAALVLGGISYHDSRHDAVEVRRTAVSLCELETEPLRRAVLSLLSLHLAQRIQYRAGGPPKGSGEEKRRLYAALLAAPPCDERVPQVGAATSAHPSMFDHLRP